MRGEARTTIADPGSGGPSGTPGAVRRHRPALAAFVALILAAGAARFVLTTRGAADTDARYASMTAVIMAAVVYFALRSRNHRERLVIAYVLIAPYAAVETAALGYTWWSGRPTIFHAAPYSLGASIEVHFWGHVVGGLTWEPLIVFVAITGLGRLFGPSS